MEEPARDCAPGDRTKLGYFTATLPAKKNGAVPPKQMTVAFPFAKPLSFPATPGPNSPATVDVPGRPIRLLVGRASAYDPRMQRFSADDRRGQLIGAALGLAAQQGVTALTIRRVAEAAGVSLAVVHYHFEDKEELLTGNVESLILANSESMRPALTRILGTAEMTASRDS